MAGADNRWWGPRSDFPWEEDALQHIRDQMPVGRAVPRLAHLHLHRADRARQGTRPAHRRRQPGCSSSRSRATLAAPRTRVHLADHGTTGSAPSRTRCTSLTGSAKELQSQLEQAARQLKIRERIPFIEAAVFLSAPNLRCEFDELQRNEVFGRDGLKEQTGLPGIWNGFLDQPPRSDASRVTPRCRGNSTSCCTRSASRVCASTARSARTSLSRPGLRRWPDLGGLPRGEHRAARRPASAGADLPVRAWRSRSGS